MDCFALFAFSIPAFVRLVASAVLVLLMFSVTVVLTKVETGGQQIEFLFCLETNVFMIVTLSSVVFINSKFCSCSFN